MATLSEARTLGGVGAILALLSFVPYAGPVLGIVGFILVLIAVNHISNIVGDRSIFNNMMISVILGIVGVIVLAVTIVGSVLRFIGLGSWQNVDWANFFRDFQGVVPPLPGEIMVLIAQIIIGVVIVWAFYLASAIFLRKSYNSIAVRLNVGMFRTAALLYLIGAALAIILVGFIIVFVAEILVIVAFFTIPDQLPQPQQST